MDIKNDNYTRFKNYDLWESKKNAPYNYDKNGVLNKIISNKISSSSNPTLLIILNYIDRSLVFLMKYIDRLKNFKNPHWLNR